LIGTSLVVELIYPFLLILECLDAETQFHLPGNDSGKVTDPSGLEYTID